MLSFQDIPRRGRSSGWMEIRQYAPRTSIFVRRVPQPSLIIKLTASATWAYDKVKSSLLMPSLTLCLAGKDRSTMSLHLPGWPRLGITPNLLT